MDYHLSLDLEVLRFLLSLPARDRGKILPWLEKLKTAPNMRGKFDVRDATGRDVEVSSVANYLIYHWSDHAVKTVQIVKLEASF